MNKLNLPNASLPEYTITLPVSKIQAKFRPFLVKEEKILLIALQSKSTNQINDAMRNVIMACTNGQIDTKTICAADSEYAFLQLRAKSVGEEAKPQVICNKCNNTTTVKIRLDEINITQKDKTYLNKESFDPNIKITDDLTLVMRYPSIHEIDHNKTEVDIAFDIAKICIESIILNDQVYSSKEIDPKELSSFIDNLLPNQFKSIMDFLQTVPELKYEFSCNCPTCKEPILVKIESIIDFFQ